MFRNQTHPFQDLDLSGFTASAMSYALEPSILMQTNKRLFGIQLVAIIERPMPLLLLVGTQRKPKKRVL
jgi:hypothetical protein